MPRRTGLTPAGLLLMAGCLNAADISAPLRVNPFLRPAADAAAGDVRGAADAGTMELRAIMLAGEHSLASIGGRIVGIGEEINGYRLVAVNGDGVVLERDGTRKVLAVVEQDGVGHDRQVDGSW